MKKLKRKIKKTKRKAKVIKHSTTFEARLEALLIVSIFLFSFYLIFFVL